MSKVLLPFIKLILVVNSNIKHLLNEKGYSRKTNLFKLVLWIKSINGNKNKTNL